VTSPNDKDAGIASDDRVGVGDGPEVDGDGHRHAIPLTAHDCPPLRRRGPRMRMSIDALRIAGGTQKTSS
jgi:hypothetical protein